MQPELHLAESHAAELGRKVRGPQALPLHLVLERPRSRARDLVVGEIEGLESGRSPRRTNAAHPLRAAPRTLARSRSPTPSSLPPNSAGPGGPAPTGRSDHSVARPCRVSIIGQLPDTTVCGVTSASPVVFRRASSTGTTATVPQVALGSEERAVVAAAEQALLDERRLLSQGRALDARRPPRRSRDVARRLWHTRSACRGAGLRWRSRGSFRRRPGAVRRIANSVRSRHSIGSPVKATPFLNTVGRPGHGCKRDVGHGSVGVLLVLAIRGPDERTLERILELVPSVQEQTGLNVAVSAGILTDAQAARLAERRCPPLQPQHRNRPVILSRRSSRTHTWKSAPAHAGWSGSTGWSCAVAP